MLQWTHQREECAERTATALYADLDPDALAAGHGRAGPLLVPTAPDGRRPLRYHSRSPCRGASQLGSQMLQMGGSSVTIITHSFISNAAPQECCSFPQARVSSRAKRRNRWCGTHVARRQFDRIASGQVRLPGPAAGPNKVTVDPLPPCSAV